MSDNQQKTYLLMAIMAAIFIAVGYLIGGAIGATIALAVACAMNFFTYWNADKLVLRMYRALPVEKESDLYRLVAKLAQRAGLPMPRVYIINNPQPNAFATGRDPEHAAVAATTGLLQNLDSLEVAGVMAHELAHIQNRDTLLMTLTATLAGALSMLANISLFTGRNRQGGMIATIAMMIFAPLAASMVQMAISRTREYSADRRGAEICGDPESLASALRRIERMARQVPNNTAENVPASAPLFIINPLNGQQNDNWFSTHPNTQNRIDKLMELSEELRAHQAQNSDSDSAREEQIEARHSRDAIPIERDAPPLEAAENTAEPEKPAFKSFWDQYTEDNPRGPWG